MKKTWKLEGDSDPPNSNEFGKLITAISNGEYVPSEKRYPSFRKMYFEEPIYNPPILTTNQTHGYDAYIKDQSTLWGNTSRYSRTKFLREPRFKEFTKEPLKPEQYWGRLEETTQYWGRTRRKNPFARAKACLKPSEEKSIHILEEHRKRVPPLPEQYNPPDNWVRAKTPVCGILKPNAVMESTSSRELFDFLQVPKDPDLIESPLERPQTASKSTVLMKPLLIVEDGPSSTPLTIIRYPSNQSQGYGQGLSEYSDSPPDSPAQSSSPFANTYPPRSLSPLQGRSSPSSTATSMRDGDTTNRTEDISYEKSVISAGARSQSSPNLRRASHGRDGHNQSRENNNNNNNSANNSIAGSSVVGGRSSSRGGYSERRGFHFPKEELTRTVEESDPNSVRFRRVVTPNGQNIIVPIHPGSRLEDVLPEGAVPADTWATSLRNPADDEQLRCLTPLPTRTSHSGGEGTEKRGYLSASRGTDLDVNALEMPSLHTIEASNHPLRSKTFSRRGKTPPSRLSQSALAPTSVFTTTDALPRAYPMTSPVKPLSEAEAWKPPRVPGKSALRKASERRELDALLKTKSRIFPPEHGHAVPVSVADMAAISDQSFHSLFAEGSHVIGGDSLAASQTSSPGIGVSLYSTTGTGDLGDVDKSKASGSHSPQEAYRIGSGNALSADTGRHSTSSLYPKPRKNRSQFRAHTTSVVVRNKQRGGGDVLGRSRRPVEPYKIAEASTRSALLLNELSF